MVSELLAADGALVGFAVLRDVPALVRGVAQRAEALLFDRHEGFKRFEHFSD